MIYEAGPSPPQTIWKEDIKLDPKCIFHWSNVQKIHVHLLQITFLCLSTLLCSFPVFLIFFYGNKTYVQVLLPIALISMMIAYITLSVTMLPNGLSLLIVCLITVGIYAYCVLAIEVVKKIVQSIYGFAAERASHILTLARRKWKPSSADVSKEEAWPARSHDHLVNFKSPMDPNVLHLVYLFFVFLG